MREFDDIVDYCRKNMLVIALILVIGFFVVIYYIVQNYRG